MFTTNQKAKKKVTFWKFFRLIYLLFSLYLMGDAFYRWDGFSYYASFLEFLPSIALVSIFWSIVSVLTATLAWILFKLLERICGMMGIEIRTEHLLLYTFFFALLGALAWKGKKLIWPLVLTTSPVKFVVLISVVLISVLPAWLFRKRAERWVGLIQESITPLVWLFGIFVLMSVPLVAYYTWGKQADNIKTNSITSTSKAGDNRPNVILLTFDALAAQNMSLYGYQKETTPFISEWAKKATVFTMVEADSNFTTSSTASLMTGKRVWTHQTYHIEGTKPANSRNESLPSLLKAYGYFNVALVVNPHTSASILGISNSIDIAPSAVEFSTPLALIGARFGYIEVFLYRFFADKIRLYDWIIKKDFILYKLIYAFSKEFSRTQVPPEIVLTRFLQIIDNKIPQPYFAWIHILPPHDPYLPPGPYKGFFNPSLELMKFKLQEELKVEAYKYLFQYLPYPKSMEQPIALLKDYYDDFIRYCDDQLKVFYGELSKRNELENTVLILSADHGESFEHGYFTHGGPFLYEQVTHIPLVISLPGQTTGRVVSDLVEQVDIPATILDLVNIPAASWMEGGSLVPMLQGAKLSPKHAFSMNFENNPSRGNQIKKGSIAVWEGDYKLIHYLEKEKSLLFNLKQDPAEMTNLFDVEKEKGQYLLGLLLDNLKKANERIRAEKILNSTLKKDYR